MPTPKSLIISVMLACIIPQIALSKYDLGINNEDLLTLQTNAIVEGHAHAKYIETYTILKQEIIELLTKYQILKGYFFEGIKDRHEDDMVDNLKVNISTLQSVDFDDEEEREEEEEQEKAEARAFPNTRACLDWQKLKLKSKRKKRLGQNPKPQVELFELFFPKEYFTNENKNNKKAK